MTFMTENEFKRFEQEILTGTNMVIEEDELRAMVEAGVKVDLESLVVIEQGAAKLMGISVRKLKKRRKRGWAPPYIKVRRQVYYHLPDILERIRGGHC
jgi:hypothetical protein